MPDLNRIWKAQEVPAVQVDGERLRAMARSREGLNMRVNVVTAVVIVGIACAMLVNIYHVEQPWIRVGQAWTLAVMIYLFGSSIDRGKWRSALQESCVAFLERQHEERRAGYLRLRDRLFLLLPGIGFSWLGGGPPSVSPVFRPWIFAALLAALVLVWLALGAAAKKAAQERDELKALAERG